MNSQLNFHRKGLLRRGWIPLAIMLGMLPFLPSSSPAQTYLPSTSDLWDISQATVVTATSGMNSAGSDSQDMFGGQFSSVETGYSDFADGRPPGFVHYTQWQTPGPVTVGSFVLFAQGDGAGPFPSQREFAQFVLKAKSSPSATNYDLTLYTLVVTNHPYNYVDAVNHALVAANITPVTAQYFRAEFTQYNAGNGFDGPRIQELDGFGQNLPTCDSSPSGQVSWWQGEGDVGDAAGTNNGTIQGGLTFAGGKVGQAFQFNGTSGYAVVPASTSLDVGQGPGMTIECWIKPADATLLRPVTEWNNGSGGYGVHFWINQPTPFGSGPGSLYANVVDATGQGHSIDSAAGLIVPNIFQHVALTYDRASGMAQIYLNGAMVAQQYIGSFALQTSYPLYFGYRPSGDAAGTLFTGEMDEIGLYNRALSSAEIQAIYNAGGAGKCGLALGAVTVQPPTQTVNSGGSAAFTAVVSSGSRPLAYQWSLGGVPLAGATSSSLTLNNVQATNGGNYSVQVSNIFGSTNSSPGVLTVNPPPPLILPSSNDLWDVSQGAVVTATSGVNAPSSDARDMFGGTFSPSEPGNTVFADGKPAGFVHYTQWQTLGPVTVTNFVLFASGDVAPPFPTQREFAQFVLKAKSSPSATNYDLTLYTLVVTNHPYTYMDPVNHALVAANIAPVTAQYFRAEFTQYNAGNSHDGPRILELDGFGPNAPVVISGPTNAETFAGTSTTFSVAVEGSAPLSYQWQENSTNIPAAVNPTATNATLVLTNVQADQYGYAYSVLVTNVYGLTNSSNALLTVLGPGSCFPPAAGMVGWWPGEHNAIDIAGTNKGTLIGGVTFTNGEVGQAFNLNGTSQYVDVPNSATLNPANKLTVEAWVYEETPTQGAIVKKAGEGMAQVHGYALEVDNPGPTLVFGVYVGGGVGWGLAYTVPLPLKQWVHVAGVYNGTNLSVYTNGVLAATPVPVSGPIIASGNDLNIGHDSASPTGNYFNGLIDEPTVYNTALSAAQIQDIYLAGSAGKCSEPVITGQPQSQVDYYGSSIVLSANAVGTGALSYQWLDNGAVITNATNSTLMLNNLQFANAGAYSVVISNAYGVVTSAPAFLTVNPAGVSIALYSGITISGVPGLTYGIQYSTDLSNSNAWLGLTNVTLIGTNALSFDLQPATLSRRYYRVVPGPISIP